jgi:hypothetical protein
MDHMQIPRAGTKYQSVSKSAAFPFKVRMQLGKHFFPRKPQDLLLCKKENPQTDRTDKTRKLIQSKLSYILYF